MRIWSHQNCITDGCGGEQRALKMTSSGGQSDQTSHRLLVSAVFSLMLTHETKVLSQLNKMFWAGVRHGEPPTRSEYTCDLGEVFRCHHADNKIDRTISDRPFTPQINSGKCQARP